MLAAVSAVPVLALSGWLLAGLPLLLLGRFRPLPMAVLGGGLAVLLCRYALRRLPPIPGATPRRTAAVLGIAAASGVFNGVLHSEQLVVRRDPATYAQYAIWLARHGSLPIPAGDFGGPDPALHFGSMGFYATADGVVPQFMPGPPMIYAIGHWIAGIPGLLLVPPVLGALAVLTFAGTVARLAGPRWAAPAALTLAVSLPLLYTSRTTFSEIPSLILLFGAMSLCADALAAAGVHPPGAADRRADAGPAHPAPGVGARALAALSGLAFGLALLVRIDGLRDVLPVLPFAGLLIALGRIARTGGAAHPLLPAVARLGPPLLAGLAAGTGWGFAAGHLLSRPYLGYLSDSLTPLLAIAAGVLAVTAVGTALAPWLVARGGGSWTVRRLAGRLPGPAAALTVAVAAGLAVRPWLHTVRRTPENEADRLTAAFIEAAQRVNGLDPDPTRLYYERSLHWVFWYLGVPAVALAVFAAAVLAGRLLRGREFRWLLPWLIICWTTVTTLWRPAITPDHPWASRRLVPIVIPGLILLAVWGLRRLREAARRSGRPARAVTGLGIVLLIAPAAITSIGTAFTPVGRGEAAATAGLCAALPRDAAVLIIERVTGDRFTQLVRGQCGVPVARVATRAGTDVASPAHVTRLVGKVRRLGRVPVLLAAEPGQLARYGPPVRALRLHTRQDERSLTGPPDGTWSLVFEVWLTVPR